MLTMMKRMNKMAISSINFAKATAHSEAHNEREDTPNYLLPKEYRLKNEVWKHKYPEHKIFMIELEKANRLGGPKPKFENSRWEAVLNLNKEHTLEDVQKVARHIEQEFNITASSITIHRDEGVMKSGKPKYNFHAHINFVTYKDGKQNWRLTHTKKKLPKLQTRVAEILKMQRGKEGSGKLHLNPKQYKAQIREQERNAALVDSLKSRIANLDKEMAAMREAIEKQKSYIAFLEKQIEGYRTQKPTQPVPNHQKAEKINPEPDMKRKTAKEIYEQKLAERGLSNSKSNEETGTAQARTAYQQLRELQQKDDILEALKKEDKQEKKEEPKKRGWFR